MQQYVQRHFAGHPLVVGVVAGLVARYRPAPGDFDHWAEDSLGGADVDLASMDLVQRRNHILKEAFDDLTADERVLMARLGLVSDAVDLATIEALNPHRPDPPEKVEEPMPPERRRNWELRHLESELNEVEGDRRCGIQHRIDELKAKEAEEYEREKSAHEEYLRLLEIWQKSPELKDSGNRLRQTLDDLEKRGLLNWDRPRNQYDLHPVVRNYAVHCLPVAEREQIGRKVVDHFTSRADQPYEAAETMADVRNGLQVARSLIQVGDLKRAYDVLNGEITNAFWYNLERYNEYLALLRPYFPDGWTKPPQGLERKVSLGHVAGKAAAALSSVGRITEALAADEHAITPAVGEKELSSFAVRLSNHCKHQMDASHVEAAERVLLLEEELAALDTKEEHRPMAIELRFIYSLEIGKTGEAEAALEKFNSVPHPKYRGLYQPGLAELHLVELRLCQNRLDEELLSVAMRHAWEGKNRGVIRVLHNLRGEWLLSIGRLDRKSTRLNSSHANISYAV